MAYAALVAAALLALYFLASYAIYRRAFVADKPAFLDDFTFTPFEFQADSEEVELVTADGISFGAWHFRQPGSPQTVIVSGGHKGQRTNSLGISAALWRKGFNVILYSYRGMPGSDRAPITFGIKEVLELDRQFSDLRSLLEENVRRTFKLPGGPFVWLAALLLRLRSGSRLSECSPQAVLSSLEPRPLFFIHGGADEMTSVIHSRRLYDAYRGPREIWIVQGAPHTGAYFADRPLYVERVAGFFARHLGLDVSGHLRLVEEEEVS